MAQMHVVSHQAAQHHGVAASETPSDQKRLCMKMFSGSACTVTTIAKHVEESHSAGRSARHNILTAVLMTSLIEKIQSANVDLHTYLMLRHRHSQIK